MHWSNSENLPNLLHVPTTNRASTLYVFVFLLHYPYDHTNWQSIRFIQIVNPYEPYELQIRMFLTDCKFVCFLRITNLYGTDHSCRCKKITSSAIAPQHPSRQQPQTYCELRMNHLDNAPWRNQPQHGRRSSSYKKNKLSGVRRKQRRKERRRSKKG